MAIIMRTLCIDIGGTGIKSIVYDEELVPRNERGRVPTPRPARPSEVFLAIKKIADGAGEFDRVSLGFPGVVIDGVTKTAPNLDEGWADIPIADEVSRICGGKPTRVANDADVQGLAVIEKNGVEMVLTLGTGMGSALYIDGKSVPNLELGHHPFRKGKTYEERVSDAERKRIGPKRWSRRVARAIETLGPIFNYRKLYLGGGNARRIVEVTLPDNVVVIDNVAGLEGGVRLWNE